MKKVLVYSDSLFFDLHIPESLISIHVESFNGITAEEAVLWLDWDDPRSLRFMLEEDAYNIVLICFGTNDVGANISPTDVVKNVMKLLNFAQERCKNVYLTLLNENDYKNNAIFNRLIRQTISNKSSFFDFFKNIDQGLLLDGLHLNEKGKSELTSLLITMFNQDE